MTALFVLIKLSYQTELINLTIYSYYMVTNSQCMSHSDIHTANATSRVSLLLYIFRLFFGLKWRFTFKWNINFFLSKNEILINYIIPGFSLNKYKYIDLCKLNSASKEIAYYIQQSRLEPWTLHFSTIKLCEL